MKLKINQDWLIAFALLAFALLFRIPFLITQGMNLFNADHAVLGLMARHILEGKFMVYYYGQGYMGSIEAFVAAAVFAVCGSGITALQCAPLLFFCAFLIVNYFLVRTLFNRPISIFANFVLACGSPVLSALSITALGGYPEILFFSSAALLCWITAEEKKSMKLMAAAGVLAGVGMWTHSLVAVYGIAYLLFWFLHKGLLKPSKILDFVLVRHQSLPVILCWAVRAVHAVIGYYIIMNLVGVLTGIHLWNWGPIHLDIPSPPFQMKKIKKILLFLGGEALAIAFFKHGLSLFVAWFKKYIPFIAGVLVGHAPVLGFTLAGGEGYRVLHSSGIIYLNQWPARMMDLAEGGILRGVLGAPIAFLEESGAGASGFLSIFFLVFQAVLLGSAFFQIRKLKKWNDWSLYPFAIFAVNIGICFFSTLLADRYLMPCYFAVSLVTAFAVYQIYLRSRVGAVIVLVLILAQSVFAHSLYQLAPKKMFLEGTQRLFQRLEQEGVRGGYADYWKSYPFTFLSREKLIFAPYMSPDRYPAYTDFVRSLPRAAYVFEETDPQFGGIEPQLIAEGRRFTKYFEAPFWVFVAEQKPAID